MKDIATVLGNTMDMLKKNFIILDESDVEYRYDILVV